ncbi:MAG: MBOAT family O-acyltransferase [Chthoniobacterales bacterium]
MIFDTFFYYFVILVPSAIAFRLVAPALRPWICVTFGAVFFLYFSLTQLGGVPGAACLSLFFWEACFSRLYKPRSRWCIAGIVQAIGILFVFKYWNFFAGLFVGSAPESPVFWRGAFLPLGISFFTFEFIHFAADRYRGTAKAGTFGEYLAFILFFPTMVAGPIKRFQDFVPKLQSPSKNWALDWHRGVTRILAGLVKKFAIADLLGAWTINLNHGAIALADRRVLPLWLLAYGIKIYIDFSAYSDIAIGSARLFGIRVPENFDWPYLRRNITEFWRHWHISLSRWLMDYVYIPLGGSRVSSPRIYGNIILTMLISGLWHGAGLNFIAWGLWHGCLLAGHRLWRKNRPVGNQEPSLLGSALSWALTFLLVNLGWAFFCMDFPTALFFFRRLLLG